MFLLHNFFLCLWRKTVEAKRSCLEEMGITPFLFWSSVFDLLLGATVNKVAMTTAGEEAKTYHVIEAYTAA